MHRRYLSCPGAVDLPGSCDCKQCTDLLEREAKLAGSPYEAEPVDIRRAIAAIAATTRRAGD